MKTLKQIGVFLLCLLGVSLIVGSVLNKDAENFPFENTIIALIGIILCIIGLLIKKAQIK